MLKSLGADINDDFVDLMLSVADENEDAKVNFEEFIVIVTP